jgi:hypothetical protein
MNILKRRMKNHLAQGKWDWLDDITELVCHLRKSKPSKEHL